MAIDIQEILSDLGPALQLVRDVESAVAALPTADSRKPSDILKFAATVLTAAGPLADTIAEQAKD